MNTFPYRKQRLTLVEVTIASGIFLLAITLSLRTMFMGWSQVKSGQSQLFYQSSARFGSEKILQKVQNARSVSITSSGNRLYVLNEDNSIHEIYYDDEDGNPLTVIDNRIWVDVDSAVEGNEQVIVSNVSPLKNEKIFRSVGTGVAITFNVGDPANSTAGDAISGVGHQGALVRLVAKPRNVGHTWTLNQNIKE